MEKNGLNDRRNGLGLCVNSMRCVCHEQMEWRERYS